VGVNLNPDKVCNFDCIYCQVDRRSAAETKFVALPQLLEELEHTLGLIQSGEIYTTTKFHTTPVDLRRLNDIAFSGDGEPTTFRNFLEILEACAKVKQAFDMHHVKFVLITNASMFHRERVQQALHLLDQHQGEVWAKLDAGTAEYFQRIDRTTIPFERILENIAQAARVRPLVIQSLFMRVAGESPTAAEIDAYCERLNEMVTTGGQFQLVQIYTVARQPAESYVTPLTHAEIDAIVARVQHQTHLPTRGFYGAAD
jgi:wyosine [tRNA(Phe)-imidazoG37] synthetase (radical SAM superfamily)